MAESADGRSASNFETENRFADATEEDTALKMAGKKYHGEGKIGENHNICGKIAKLLSNVNPAFVYKMELT
jgi:hypothetical protein